MKSGRLERVNEILKRELSDNAERLTSAELNTLTTITAVKTSTDLRHADVWVSVFGNDDEKQRAIQVFSKHRVEFQKAVAAHVPLKYTPVLTFKLDETNEQAERIYSIVRDLGLEEGEHP